MRGVFIFIFLISFGFNSYSQFEFGGKFKAIPPKFNPKPKKVALPFKEVPAIVTPNVFKSPAIFNPKTPTNSSSYSIGKAKEFSMVPTNEFANPGDVYMEKMAKDLDKTLHENEAPLDRKNRYLGDFRTKSLYFTVKYRDYGQIDGDMLKVILNSKIIKNEMYLDYKFNEFRIYFNEGFNELKFIAQSTGSIGGNTAEIHIYDDVNREITNEFWDNLDEGVEVKMIIIKE